MTQSSATVEYRPGQCNSSGESVPEASEFSEIRSITTQSPLTKESLLKRRRSDSDNYSLRLYHVKITLHIQFVISLTSPDHIKLVNRKNYTENYTIFYCVVIFVITYQMLYK